jgi:hypothetical protein
MGAMIEINGGGMLCKHKLQFWTSGTIQSTGRPSLGLMLPVTFVTNLPFTSYRNACSLPLGEVTVAQRFVCKGDPVLGLCVSQATAAWAVWACSSSSSGAISR